jgi:hypothetical protein
MAERKTSKVVNVAPDTIVVDGKDVPNPEAGKLLGTITFTFSDDTTETFEIGKVPEAIRDRLALHGAGQKIGDSYAGAAATDDPLAYAKEAVKDTIAQLYRGDWRVTGGGGGPRVNELAMAISRAGGETLEECIEFVGAMTDEDKKVWRKKPKVALALAQIAAEKTAKRIAELQKAADAEDAKDVPATA